MPATLYTSNASEYLRHPGMYVTEVDPPGFVKGVSLGTAGVFGQTLRGPVNTPVEITSFARFTEIFGHRSRYGQSTEVNMVRQFFLAKQFGKVVVVRAAAAAAAAAEMDFANVVPTAIINVAATSAGAWGNDLTVAIEAASNGVSTSFNLRVNYRGGSVLYKNLSCNSTDDNLAEVIGTDLGNLVVVTKLANGRPLNAAAAALTDTAGADGTIADADYTGTGKVIPQIKGYPGIATVNSADRMTAAIKSALYTAAVASSDRIFTLWSGTHGDSIATVATDAASYRSDRVIYCFNSPYIIDPETATEIRVPPTSFMASVLAMTDVDFDPIDEDAKQYLAGISRLTYESLVREDFITLSEAGICGIEKLEGFNFANSVVNLLTAGLELITRRRQADYLILSMASRMAQFKGKLGIVVNQLQLGSELIAFNQGLKDAPRIVKDFSIDLEAENTEATKSQGLFAVLYQADLQEHMRSLVLLAQIGTTVVITEQS